MVGGHWRTTSPPQMDALGCCILAARGCRCAALTVKLSPSSRSQTRATASLLISVLAQMPSYSLISLPPAPSHPPATVCHLTQVSTSVFVMNIRLLLLTAVHVSAAVELEYSLDLGLTWLPLVRDCLPTSPDCSSYTLQRLLVSDTYNKWGRVTLPVPHYAR